MDAGSLDRRVTLHRAGAVENEHGDMVQGWSELATVWASVRPSPGSERLASAEAAANAPTVVTIRWSSIVADLSPADRLEYPVGSGRFFNIVSVVELGRRDGLQLAAIGRA
jgi:head-tail adaptor